MLQISGLILGSKRLVKLGTLQIYTGRTLLESIFNALASDINENDLLTSIENKKRFVTAFNTSYHTLLFLSLTKSLPLALYVDKIPKRQGNLTNL